MTEEQKAVVETAEALGNYASADVTRIARFHRLGKTAGKYESIGQLVPLLADPEWCWPLYERLPAAGKALLRAIALADDANSMVVLAACSQHGAATARKQLDSLLDEGLILARSPRNWGRLDLRYAVGQREISLFLAPGVAKLVAAAEAVEPAVASELLPEIPDARVLEVRPGNPAELLRVLRDLTLLASRRHLKMTAAGRLAANQVDLVARELGLGEGALPLDLVLDIARTGNIIAVREGRLAPGSAAQGLLIEAPDRVIGRLFNAFVKSGSYMDDLPANPDEARYATPDIKDQCAARRVVVDVVRTSIGPGFSDVEAVADRVLKLAPGIAAKRNIYAEASSLTEAPTDPYQRAVQREFIRCVLVRTCRTFGLVDVGVLDRNAAVTGRPRMDYQYWDQFEDVYYSRFRNVPAKPRWQPTPCGFAIRLTPLGRAVLRGEVLEATPAHETRSLRVGADFEVLAPTDKTPVDVLLRLSAFSRCVPGHATDPVKRFRIERTAFLDALRAGLDAEEALAFLAGAAARALPDNVVRTVRDWAGTYGALTLYSNFDLLEYASPAARDEGLAVEKHAFAVSDRFALTPMKPRAASRVIDYESATPPRCMSVDAQGRVTVDPEAADLWIERDLATIAEPVEPPAVWRLTRESLARSGEPAANLLIRLRSRSTSPLPGGVAALVKGACGAVPSLPLANLDVLVVPDAELLHELMDRPEVKQEIAGTIAPTVAVVRPGRRKALDKALAAIGVKTEAAWDPSPDSTRSRSRP